MPEFFEVKDMTCSHCVESVTNELKKIKGVSDVSVELESGKVSISSDVQLDRQKVQAAIEEAGYELVG